MTNGHYCTAWDLCGNWDWMELHLVRLKGGRALYEEAHNSKNGLVKLCRVNPDLTVTVRYVHPDMEIELVRRDE